MKKSLTNNEFQGEFEKVLSDRINSYFKDNDISKKSDSGMFFKIMFSILFWIGSYFMLFLHDYPYWTFILLYLVHGLSHILMTVGVAHDANHLAISNNQRINKILCYAFDVCGVSSFLWRFVHNQTHHGYVNIHGHDNTLTTGGLIRLAPGAPRKAIHKYQHIYVWALYCLYTLDAVTARDFIRLFSKKNNVCKDLKYSGKDIITVILGKLFYFGYMILIPSLFLDYSVFQIIGAFFITHLIIGIILLLTFQSSHLTVDTAYPSSKDEPSSYFEHIFSTTADYSAKNKLFSWFIGGLNLHVIHHLAPQVCHTHYPALTEIIESTASEFNMEYRQNKTIFNAISSHYALLKKLGRDN